MSERASSEHSRDLAPGCNPCHVSNAFREPCGGRSDSKPYSLILEHTDKIVLPRSDQRIGSVKTLDLESTRAAAPPPRGPAPFGPPTLS